MPFLDEVNKWVGPGSYQNFFGGPDPSKEASKYIGQIPGQTGKILNPYNQAGAGAIPTLQGQYGELLNDPGGFINKIGAGYKQSPGFQFALQQALGGANRAAAAGGMAGSPSAQTESMGIAEGLASEDYMNYLKTALSQYGLGLEGEQGLYGGGLQAGTSQSDMIAQALAAQAKLKYEGQQAQNQFFPNMIGAGAKALPYIMG